MRRAEPGLGKPKKCDGLAAYRVDGTAIAAGTPLSRYYMHRHERLIDRLQPSIAGGPKRLIEFLSASEWQDLQLTEHVIGLDSDVTKMMVVLEAIFEHTRIRLAPNLPSRLRCSFVWPTLDTAKTFRERYQPEGVIHLCRLERGMVVELDGGLLPPGISLADLSPEVFLAEFQATQSRARNYWLAEEPPILPELLVLGEAKVVGPAVR